MALTRQQLKDIKSLRTKKGRNAHNKFVAEGVRLLETALERSKLPQTILCAPDALSERATALVERFRHSGVQVEEVSSSQLASVADTETPQGVIGVFPHPAVDLETVYGRHLQRIVICDGVSDPGNLGTLIRSALAFDFHLLVVTNSSADPYSPKVVRSSVGALFALTIAAESETDVLALLEKEMFELIVTSNQHGSDTSAFRAAVRTDRLAVAIGSESKGVSPAIVERSQLAWRVNHSTQVESLNAAIAGSIVLKEIYDLRSPSA